jgi:xanthine dehydrogenase accessory factor
LECELKSKLNEITVLIRGGGEVASAIAHRLIRAGFHACLTEIPLPLAIHRGTTFCEAVFDGKKTVEGVTAVLVDTYTEIQSIWRRGELPLVIDPEAGIKNYLHPHVFVDATMMKKNLGTKIDDAQLVIGVGPGFKVGRDVHFVIETYHNENLGKVITRGAAEKNTGIPLNIGGATFERAIHAPVDGTFREIKHLGDRIAAGDTIALVDDHIIKAEIGGILRGILRSNIAVQKGVKIAEIDPLNSIGVCYNIRAKMRAIAGGVLEVIMMTFNH